MKPPVSHYCAYGNHYLCTGAVQREDGLWEYCECPTDGCICAITTEAESE